MEGVEWGWPAASPDAGRHPVEGFQNVALAVFEKLVCSSVSRRREAHFFKKKKKKKVYIVLSTI